MTATQAAQLEARLKDKWWRLTNLYLILTEDGATEPLTMRSEQVEFLTNRHNRNFVPKARKLGMSTVIVLDNLDEGIFRPDTKAGIIDLTREDAHAKLAMAKFAWDNGPFHPDPAIAALWREIHKANPLKKDTAGALEWKNGSEFTAGVAFTGRTPQRLHISEYGPISARSPNKASAIKRGAINSVPPDGIIDIETTMEGGRFGECYAIFKLALSKVGKPVTKMDWKLHFFPWFGHPSYVLAGQKPSQADIIEYFAKVRRDHGVDVPLERQAWYERKKAEQQGEMWQQFPTTIEEVDRLTVPGQVYPEMKSVRAGGRVVAFEPEKGLPTFTAWDLGSSDNMAGWLIQPAGKAHNFLDWCSGEGAGAAGVAQVIRAWEERHGSILAHFLPHDCNITDKGSGKTFLQQLIECGIPAEKLIVVPRIPDVWVGIDEVRRILPNCWFHERTDQPVTVDGAADLPGGVGRLEGYRKQIVQSTNITKDVPVHDICSHTADAVRTYAEALSRDMVGAHMVRNRGPAVVLSGFVGHDAPISWEVGDEEGGAVVLM